MRVLLFSLLLGFTTVAFAADPSSLRIEQPWAAETPPVARTGAVYLSIVNDGVADRLLHAKTEIAPYVELHTTTMDGGVMRMRKIEVLDVPSSATVTLEPGHVHIMLIGLKQPLRADQSFPLMLEFEKTGMLEIQVPIRPREGMQPVMPERGHPAHDSSSSMKME